MAKKAAVSTEAKTEKDDIKTPFKEFVRKFKKIGTVQLICFIL